MRIDVTICNSYDGTYATRIFPVSCVSPADVSSCNSPSSPNPYITLFCQPKADKEKQEDEGGRSATVCDIDHQLLTSFVSCIMMLNEVH